jgi:hypothetical protein
MKATVKQLRSLINEAIMAKPLGQPEGVWLEEGQLSENDGAYLHGVSEWMLREDITNFVNVIRKRIESFILLNKSENGADQREAIDAMNDVCDELEEKVYAVLEDQLFTYSRRV